ncbi:MAG: hypothetical protein IPM10_09930 [Chitinophagaceae bacterium]|nr:hypothetical protein [Chitinophagaceae bacterium]
MSILQRLKHTVFNMCSGLFEHNISESRGFTLRHRPWTLIRTENFSTKKDAMLREKFYTEFY